MKSFLKEMTAQMAEADVVLAKDGIVVPAHTLTLATESSQRNQFYLESLSKIQSGADVVVDWDRIEAVLKSLT